VNLAKISSKDLICRDLNMVCLLLLTTIFSAIGLAVSAAAKAADDKLQVHLIMHTHDDPGWLKTADQYYTGANASVYLASV